MAGNTEIILGLVCRIGYTETDGYKIRGEAVNGIIESLRGITLRNGHRGVLGRDKDSKQE
jgi:hypothetical protein